MGRPSKDYTGLEVGQLKVLYKDNSKPSGSGYYTYWICECSCGNLVSMSGSYLSKSKKDGRNCSCGKCHAQRKDLRGQRFGKLVAIEPDLSIPSTEDNGWRTHWICKCDCGNICSIATGNLNKLHTTSCGCANRSIGEENIEKILKENNIKYAKEFTFQDLKDKGRLRFDFAIFNENNTLSHLIEFDGRQHSNDYIPWNSEETLKERQRRDKIKDDYCKENNITLIRINYSKRDSMNISDLMIGDNNDI